MNECNGKKSLPIKCVSICVNMQIFAEPLNINNLGNKKFIAVVSSSSEQKHINGRSMKLVSGGFNSLAIFALK